MSQLIHVDKEYKSWIADMVSLFRQGQVKAVVRVNQELLLFYWRLGKDLSELDFEHKYGKEIIRMISEDLQSRLPGIKGLSETNIYYCRRWYSLYINEFSKFPQVVGKSLEAYISLSDAKFPQPAGNSVTDILPQLVAEFFSIPWTHHRYIIDKIGGDAEKGLFYVHQAFQHGWSRAVLLNWMDTDLYARQGKSLNNFDRTLPEVEDIEADLNDEEDK